MFLSVARCALLFHHATDIWPQATDCQKTYKGFHAAFPCILSSERDLEDMGSSKVYAHPRIPTKLSKNELKSTSSSASSELLGSFCDAGQPVHVHAGGDRLRAAMGGSGYPHTHRRDATPLSHQLVMGYAETAVHYK
jgi:hypothetical protein